MAANEYNGDTLTSEEIDSNWDEVRLVWEFLSP